MDVEEYSRRLHEGAKKVRETLGEAKIAVILGSGLGNFASQIEDAVELPFREVPGMPLPTVHGHEGKFVGGRVGGNAVYCMAGRLHRYEGYAPFQILFSVRLFHLLGVEVYIATNAAGGSGQTMREGDLMCLSSHVNFAGFGPMDDVLCGDEWPHIDRHTATPYSDRLRHLAMRISQDSHVRMHEGIYWMNSGPTYETPSEIRAGFPLVF
jgi:purine-nucleoside phosphorylase